MQHRTSSALVLAVAFLSFSCLDRTIEVPPTLPEIDERLIEAIKYEMDDKDLPAVSISIFDTDETRLATGFGKADGVRDATGNTVYRVASLSKLFNAIAVMQLVERGVLDLDEPIQTYLPDFRPQNPFGRPITMRQLLSHRSGLVREPPIGSYFDPSEPTLDMLVASLNETEVVYEPGTRTKYSNAAVSVAGSVVERVAGQPYAEYMEEHVLRPMGMSRSSFSPRPDLMPDLAQGTMWTYDGRTFDAPEFELGLLPAANLYTTMADLGRFMAVLSNDGTGPNGPVLSRASLREMSTVQLDGTAASGFGLGFFVTKFEGRTRLQHSGVHYGHATRIYVLPDDSLGVAMVTTIDASNSVVSRLGEFALALVLAEREERPLPTYARTSDLKPGMARQVEGHYVGPRNIELRERDGQLYVDNGTEVHRLKARGDTLVVDDRLAYGFHLLPTDAGLEGPDGTYRRAGLMRTPEPITQDQAGLVGAYGWDHNTLYIFERGGRLWSLIEWFFQYPLTRVSDNEYAFPDNGLYTGEHLVFERDDAGRATQVRAANVVFERRDGVVADDIFRIDPIRPIDEIRAEALIAEPPEQIDDLRPTDLLELTSLDATIALDVRYATPDNFMGVPLYTEARAFLQRPAAVALARVQASLATQGLGLIVHDAYRPWYVTKMFWEATAESLRVFVANPQNGSRHNRGCAVDLSLVDLVSGAVLEMPSGYDEFTARASSTFPGGTARARWNRELLRDAMEAEGFAVYPAEWWHFDYKDWRSYRIENLRFDEIGAAEVANE